MNIGLIMDGNFQLICPFCGSLKVNADGKKLFPYGCLDCKQKWSGRYVLCGEDIIVDEKTGKFIGYRS